MTKESQAVEMIYITQEEYDELIAIKEIYDRATEHGSKRTGNKSAGTSDTDGSDGVDDTVAAKGTQSKDAA